MRTAKELARYMQPVLDEARMERQWERLRNFQEKPALARPRARLALALGVACLLTGLLVAFRWSAATGPLPTEGTLVETSATNIQPLTLSDGSRVLLSESSRVKLSTVRPEAVRLVLTRGAVSLDVAHDKKRSFTVSAGGYDLVVHGTRFSVTLLPGAASSVRVSVEEGRVEARDARTARTASFITAGQSWTSESPAERAPPLPKPAEAVNPEASSEAANRPAPEVDTAPAIPVPETPKARPPADSEGEQGPAAFAHEVSHADARHLLDLANAARLAGRPRDAAVALDELCKNHRNDPRAGLAALELGRLRADSFGDLKGALSAFDDAVRLASGSVREDAEARRVLTLEALGDFARCRSARDAYLAKFPNGIRASMIRGRCAAK
jgi:transmembrane sensor